MDGGVSATWPRVPKGRAVGFRWIFVGQLAWTLFDNWTLPCTGLNIAFTGMDIGLIWIMNVALWINRPAMCLNDIWASPVNGLHGYSNSHWA